MKCFNKKGNLDRTKELLGPSPKPLNKISLDSILEGCKTLDDDRFIVVYGYNALNVHRYLSKHNIVTYPIISMRKRPSGSSKLYTIDSTVVDVYL